MPIEQKAFEYFMGAAFAMTGYVIVLVFMLGIAGGLLYLVQNYKGK